MLNVVYTTHARHRMVQRSITGDMVNKTLELPDKEDTGYRAKLLAYRCFPQGCIKVVYVEESEKIIVITVMWEECYED